MIRKHTMTFATLFVAMIGYAAPASAQATRTWVSGVGDDVNPCSRTAPCKTFAGAISKTAAGGEINCLDPAGYGAVTIIKSMTIDCHYTEGGALAGGNGIVVNAQPTDVVFLRGLDIFGVNPPSNGVRFIAGGTLHIEDSVIRRFNAANSAGVSFAPSGTSQLFIRNTTIAENGNGATGGGIIVKPTGTGVARVVIDGARVLNNAAAGILIDSTGNTGAGIAVFINDSNISGTSGNAVLAVQPVGGAPISAMVTDSIIANNNAIGIGANGAAVTFRVGNTTIYGNSFVQGSGVVAANGAQVLSYFDNRLDGNAQNGAFTAPTIPKK